MSKPTLWIYLLEASLIVYAVVLGVKMALGVLTLLGVKL